MDQAAMIERTEAEQEALASAARESMRRQIVELLRMRDLLGSPELEACPRCGDCLIIVSQAATWVRDPKTRERVCAPCGTEQAILGLLFPDEIGGEG
jgi:uncharacterized protein with PIN domain